MLTPYDELMVHQSAHPFSYTPSTDLSWDDGHFIGVFNPEEQVYLAVGMRVNPNLDLIGGYCMLSIRGRQFTLRLNRCWRRDFRSQIGPFRIEVVEPLHKLELILERNASELEFRILWEGACPPLLEEHHVATNRGRRICDNTRYSQAGSAAGYLQFRGRRFELQHDCWGAVRDHSWGKYLERPPIAPDASWLPPREIKGDPRALRFWSGFRAPPFSGFFHVHETADGKQDGMDDWLAEPPGGNIYREGSDQPIRIRAVEHEIEYQVGSKIFKKAKLTLSDVNGGKWILEYEAPMVPWLPQTIGYTPGSWRDGGHFHTYHGSEELAIEWDEFDFTSQPVRYTPYKGNPSASYNSYGTGMDHEQEVHGFEYGTWVTVTAPEGTKTKRGTAHVEHFISGPYHRYGFKK